MKKLLSKPYRWAIIYSIILTGAFTFILLDTFVMPKPITIVSEVSIPHNRASAETSGSEAASFSAEAPLSEASLPETTSLEASLPEVTAEPESQQSVVVTDNSYEDENIKITIETVRKYDSDIYVADIQVSDVSYLKTAFADSIYGRNINAKTSVIAEENNAIFAINGDFYGFRDSGYVLRNGVAYRDIARSGENEALVIDMEGNLSIIPEDEKTLAEISEEGAWQVLTFGPGLIVDGNIVVDSTSEVEQSMLSNPRTAFGQVGPLHYIAIVSDGRTRSSAGLSLLQLSEELSTRGCTVAYNLDGGGSSTMYFNGEVVNNPTNGKKRGERRVSDIVYIGY